MPRFKKCGIEECHGNQVAKGLCDLHYRRQLHHGTLDQTRPTDWGSRERHPLYPRWTWMRRSFMLGVDDRWKDFWAFVTDVGDPPGGHHVLARKDSGEKFGPDNFFWTEPKIKKLGTETRKQYQRRHNKEWAKHNPEKIRESDLRKKFGIGIVDYDSMHAAQNGVCAICKCPESSVDKRTGRPRRLAVDHHHGSGKIRALLCQCCNQGLGNFRDSVGLLEAAIQYLT